MKKLKPAALGLALAATTLAATLTATPASAQQTIRMTVASGHAPVFLWVKHIKESFIPAVNAELAKDGKYRIEWNEAFGGTLAKLGSELQTIGTGVADMGMVNTLFHSGDMPLQNVGFVTPFGPGDADQVCKINDELHEKIPAMEQAWTRHNLVRLVSHCYENYGMISRSPINTVADFQGRKIGGAGPNLSWIRGSGASGVLGNFSTFYNDLKSGVFESGIVFLSGAVSGRHFEVAPHYVKVDFGAVYAGALSVNRNRWTALPEDVKKAFRSGAQAYRKAYFDETAQRVRQAESDWVKNGGKILPFAAAERTALAKMIDNPTKAWAASAEKSRAPATEVLKAYMDAMRAAGGEFARDWDKEN